jgi:ABC-2 type transport system permease protein
VSNVVGVFSAEILKLRKRPAVYVCIGLLVLLLLVLGYLISYFVFTYTKPPTGPNAPPPGALDYHAQKQSLYPLHFIQNALGGGWLLGGVLALIIGVLSMGSEFGWGTVKTAFTQRPRRAEWLIGKALSVVVAMLVMSLALLVAAALTSLVLALVDGAETSFPDALTMLKGLLATWLIYCFWAFFGFSLSIIFRQSAMAIGLGLAYALVIEALIFGLATQFVGDPARKIQQWFPLANANYLVESFGQAVRSARAPFRAPFADATHATVMLLLYTLVFLSVSLFFIQRRDVSA